MTVLATIVARALHYTRFRTQTIPFPVSCLKLTFRINTQVGAYTEFVLLKRPVAACTHLHSVAKKQRDIAKVYLN